MAHLLDVAREIFVRRGFRATTMDEVAAAAGVTKRTLYAWHRDKEALFRACIIAGAERFPRLEPEVDGKEGLSAALERYVVELHTEMSRETSYGLGNVFVREPGDDPDLGAVMRRAYFDYLIEPLAAFLRRHGLEDEGQSERALLFVAMALSPLHHTMLVGVPLPLPEAIWDHARRCVGVFLGGSRAG
ncbi:MAG: TetR/AcrR family transcriptional regulator [Novosphingobium meiothermophilum]|uniref:TetR/AcrR family transcriptional regulator n=1 Tax=Novosphingobium TaxID=165696 RepID=UPI000D6E7017|nr:MULTISPECIES: TetR/AcrR family transcriptional regulator [Novosphingobium]